MKTPIFIDLLILGTGSLTYNLTENKQMVYSDR